jgi:hypothetical protein
MLQAGRGAVCGHILGRWSEHLVQRLVVLGCDLTEGVGELVDHFGALGGIQVVEMGAQVVEVGSNAVGPD